MTHDNFLQALQAFARRRRFKTFLIELNSGDRLKVSHPEAVTLRGNFFVFTDPKSRYRLFDASSVGQVLDVLLDDS